MKVRIFRQRVTQVHEGEEEINNWLEEMGDKIEVYSIQQSAYLVDGSEKAPAGYIVSIWYNEKG